MIKVLVLNKTPTDVGFFVDFNWTAGMVAEYILKEFNVQYTGKGATLILKRLNLSFTRPTYTLVKADLQKQKKFLEDFAKVKKTGNRQNPTQLIEDESMIEINKLLCNLV